MNTREIVIVVALVVPIADTISIADGYRPAPVRVEITQMLPVPAVLHST